MLETLTPNALQLGNPTSFPPSPGIYIASGQASLLRPGMYCYLFQGQVIAAGNASIAVQLERTKSTFFYPIGFSVEISFASAPGAFEVDVQTSDTDQAAFFIKNTAVSTVNANNVCRVEMTNYWALFTRINLTSLTNAVAITAKITR